VDTKTNEFSIETEKQDLSDNNVVLVISLTNVKCSWGICG